MASSHTSQLPAVAFDDRRVIADSGLLLPAVLAQKLALRELIEEHVDLGSRVGGAHVGEKAMTLVASLLAGGDCIDEAATLRTAGMEAVLGHRVPAPSTLGTFLRAASWGHSRQWDAVTEGALTRTWALAGGGPGSLTIDLDSTICETYGGQKQGTGYSYAKSKGYQPFLATAVESGEVVHSRLRGGSASPARGAGSFARETLNRVRRAGATGPLVVRADSGFYIEEVVWACRARDARFSITVRQLPQVRAAMAQIPDDAWTSIPWAEGSAEVAETAYLAFANTHHGRRRGAISTRLIVRRVEPENRGQLPLPGLGYRYHAFITDREGSAVDLEADHRQHALIENEVRELKYDLGLNHFPSGQFAANAVWLALNVLAHNLALAVVRLGLGQPQLTVKTLRRRMFSLPGRLVRSGRRLLLRLPRHWPWAEQFRTALDRLRALTWSRPIRA